MYKPKVWRLDWVGYQQVSYIKYVVISTTAVYFYISNESKVGNTLEWYAILVNDVSASSLPAVNSLIPKVVWAISITPN